MSQKDILKDISNSLQRIATVLETNRTQRIDFEALETIFGQADTFVWHQPSHQLVAITDVNRLDLSLLKSIDFIRDQMLANTQQFANGLSANNILLWGARGMGKSSLIKAAHAHINETTDLPAPMKLIEIHREDLDSLPDLMSALRQLKQYRIIIFCDDLSFDEGDTSYKSLKTALDGGLEGRPDNVLFYATSNRRHLLPRYMIENEKSTAINPSDAIQEKVSLSDRFGLWLGFHQCNQDEYLEMINSYVDHYKIKIAENELKQQALEWSITRGSRSGRVAWQFIQDLAGRTQTKLN